MHEGYNEDYCQIGDPGIWGCRLVKNEQTNQQSTIQNFSTTNIV